MKKLSKEKQQQLILACLMIGIVLAGLWFGLINVQKNGLAAIASKRDKSAAKLKEVTRAIQTSGELEASLNEASVKLAALEEGMASGDLYAWAINTIRNFKTSYQVEIPQFSQIEGPKEMSLLPAFPYQQATMTIRGSGRFHDIGRFMADFENAFPFVRVLNVSLEPSGAVGGAEAEKLSFKMDIAALVKPTES